MKSMRSIKAYRLLALLLAAVLPSLMLLGTIIPSLAEEKQPIKITRFERDNPAYTAVVKKGTALPDLGLPKSLRAVVPMKEPDADADSFVQAEPKADMSDGDESYDYYFYGYVAPKDAPKLYQKGEDVVYTIYYANKGKEQGVGKVAYRMYGSVDGSENTWFECDANGSITGKLVDIPVSWTDGGYNADKTGKYTFTASFTDCSYSGKAPTADITVMEEKAEGEQDYKEDAKPPNKETIDKPTADKPTADKPTADKPTADKPTADKPTTDKPTADKPTADKPTADKPTADKPTADKPTADKPTADKPTADKPTADKPTADKPTADKPTADKPTADKPTVDKPTADKPTADKPTSDKPTADKPTTTDTVTAPNNGKDSAKECHCGSDGQAIAADNFPWAHQEDCPLYSPPECMCREQVEQEETITDEDGSRHTETERVPGELSHKHDPDNRDCPLYGKDTVRIKKLSSGEESVMGKDDAERIVAAQAEGKTLYPALGDIEIIGGSEQKAHADKKPRSINGGGANDAAMDQYMMANTPTSGNADSWNFYANMTIPGSWIDYLHTIWMNKAYNAHAWTTGGVSSGWKWSGVAANQSTGTVTTNPFRIPAKDAGNVWTVYSGEQLRYALINTISGDRIKLGADIDMNGSNYSWTVVSMEGRPFHFWGNNKKIVNLGVCEASGSRCGFIDRVNNCQVRDVTFVSPKLVSPSGTWTAIFPDVGATATYQNIQIEKGLFYSKPGFCGPFFAYSQTEDSKLPSNTVNQCMSIGNYVYGSDHVGGFVSLPSSMNFSHCGTVGALVVSTGGHSGGFSSCHNYTSNFSDCFADAQLYASGVGGGFEGTGTINTTYKNCYTTGKVEGYGKIGGFIGEANLDPRIGAFPKNANYIQCYSSALCGMRTQLQSQGGFIGSTNLPAGFDSAIINISDCYAVGEVGNHDVNMDNPKDVGGFASRALASGIRITYQNCYYDKQTTAMREWAAGDSKSVNGITGTLTSNTMGAAGLASGTYGGSADKGFRGFSDNSQWVYTQQHYPQLEVFANASPADWGSTVTADLVRACSQASTATVFLDTWDKGYDWDNNGVRTKDEVSYERTLGSTGKPDHKGNELTYDTVREIVSDAPVTNTSGTAWSHMIPNGAPVDKDGNGTADGNAMEVTGGSLRIKAPGMDWYKVGTTVGGQTGSRPIRLISYMDMDAGADRTVHSGEKYNHRPDVSLTMMDKLTDNLVVGLDDQKIWSTAKKGGFPKSSKYWALPTSNMETGFSASKDAWLYSEIWRAKQNPDLSFVTDPANGLGSEKLVPDISVKVTGEGTGSDLTLAEQKWNGEAPIYLDTSAPRKYLITYYWMLKDGRYRSDTKTITIVPTDYKLGVHVKDADTGAADSKSFHLGAARDNALSTGYTYTPGTVPDLVAKDVPYTQNAALAWKRGTPTATVTKSRLTMTASDGTVMGTVDRPGDLGENDTITIPVKYYYLKYEWSAQQGAMREATYQQSVNVTYTVQKDSQGGLRLRFNKLANAPQDEVAQALTGGDGSGIPALGTFAYINDMQYNVDLTLWAQGRMPFEFIKTDEHGTPFGAGDAEFQLYQCTQSLTAGSQSAGSPSLAADSQPLTAGSPPLTADSPSLTADSPPLAAGSPSLTAGSPSLTAGSPSLTADSPPLMTGSNPLTADGQPQAADGPSQVADNRKDCNWDVGSPLETVATGADGKVRFDDLKKGDYMLAETKTKQGYQLPNGQWVLHVDTTANTITISTRGDIPPAFMTEGGGAILKLPNYPKLTMPYSGRWGAIPFVAGGITLIGASAIIFTATRRRP